MRSYLHRSGPQPLLGTTIPEHFRAVVARHGHREAVVSVHQGVRLTYDELSERVDRLARGLLGLGYGPAARIGIWSTNNVEWLTLQLATARIGAILVNINPAYRPREIAYAMEQSDLQGLVVIPRFRTSDYVSMLTELLPELSSTSHSEELCSARFPHLRHVIVFDPEDPESTSRPQPGFHVWSELLDAGDAVSVQELDRVTAGLDIDDPINIQYTSGTTGFPKGVLLTHHNLLNNAWFCAEAMRFNRWDRLCVPVPFYHCFGMVVSNLLCVTVGACLVIPCEHFDAGAVLHAIEQERCTAVHGVPTMFVAELEHPDFARYDLRSLRTGIMAGAPCPPSPARARDDRDERSGDPDRLRAD